MEYHRAVNRLEGLRRLRPKLGTDTTASLLESLDDPHEGLTAVQIAGSNGKGSTARILERILLEAGVDAGLYTSPDLNDIRERIRVRGRKIPKGEVARFVETVWPYVADCAASGTGDGDGQAPTFFEAVTAMALWHFGRADAEVAVLEVGIGGRYDATSVVDPVASAVTSVSLEHTDILGSTVEEIARDKGTVAPAGRPLVTGATGAALETLRERTDVVTVGGENSGGEGSRSPSADPDVRATETETETGPEPGPGPVSPTSSSLSLVGPDWDVRTRTPLLGAHQAVNAGIAATLARQVAGATESEIAAGVRTVRWPGRFEVMDRDPLTVLDGAHNPAACETLASLLERFGYDSLHLVFGAMRDKDHRAMCRALPEPDRVSVTEPAADRAANPDALATVFERGTDAAVGTCESVIGAMDRACRRAADDDCVLVTGSLYTVAEARDRWTRTPIPVRTDSLERARAVAERADVPAEKRGTYAGRMVGRTVRCHVRRGFAAELRERLTALGGSCAVSGIEDADQHVQVLLSGTHDQFVDLVRTLRGGPPEGRHLATQLNDALGIGVEASPVDYPWTDGTDTTDATAVMGALNLRTDAGPGSPGETDAAARAREMVDAGAAVVEVGLEPGEETDAPGDVIGRVVPAIEHLDIDATVSVRTAHPAVADAALDAGADMVTDRSGLVDVSMRRVVAERDVPAVLVYRPWDPESSGPSGGPGSNRRGCCDDPVTDALSELTERLLGAERAGIDRSRVLVDPVPAGAGGRTGVDLLGRLDEFGALGTPVLVGDGVGRGGPAAGPAESRPVAGDGTGTRSAITAALAAERGADVVRVGDVPAAVSAVGTARAVTDPETPASWRSVSR